jgi:hypothetical protein
MAATSNSFQSSPISEVTPSPHPVREPINDASRDRSPSNPSSWAASRLDHSSTSSSSAHRTHHLSHQSISSQRTGGFLAFVDRTIAGITEPRVRPRQSLSRISTGPELLASVQSSPDGGFRTTRPTSKYAGSTRLTPVEGNPPSTPYSETDPSLPEPTRLPGPDNKMHQTSSRLLRMTDDDRPFTRVSACDGGPSRRTPAWTRSVMLS